jgi:hypothetical protein
MIARAAAILEYLASGGVVEPPMMIVVAHPDDETIGIEQGVAGFLVRHKWEMAEAIWAAASIDSEGWRKIAQERFSLKRMIEGYFRYYRALARARSRTHDIYIYMDPVISEAAVERLAPEWGALWHPMQHRSSQRNGSYPGGISSATVGRWC